MAPGPRCVAAGRGHRSGWCVDLLPLLCTEEARVIEIAEKSRAPPPLVALPFGKLYPPPVASNDPRAPGDPIGRGHENDDQHGVTYSSALEHFSKSYLIDVWQQRAFECD